MVQGIKLQKVHAEGSNQFINVYSANLQIELGKRVMNTEINLADLPNTATAELSVGVLEFENGEFVLVRAMPKALEKTLGLEELVLESNAKLQVGQVVFKVNKNLSGTILNADEMTYMVTYTVDNKLKKKEKAAIENIVGYFFDTCSTDADDYELYIDRFHYTSLKKPIPATEMESVITGTAHVLQQFSSIKEVTCEICKSDIEWN